MLEDVGYGDWERGPRELYVNEDLVLRKQMSLFCFSIFTSTLSLASSDRCLLRIQVFGL